MPSAAEPASMPLSPRPASQSSSAACGYTPAKPPFPGAAASEATAVAWSSSGPASDGVSRNVVFARPANAGCVGSTAPSTITIGTPGPGATEVSASIAWSHHSGGASARATVAVPSAHSAAARTIGRRRCTRLEGSATVRRVPRAFVALGSNLGDREATIRGALAALESQPGVTVVAVSTLIDTEPVGVVDQPRFLNGVAALDTDRSARDLLAVLLDVEHRFGRRREGVPPQGPRTLDLDFVLGPLAEIAPGLEVPGKGKVETLRARLH